MPSYYEELPRPIPSTRHTRRDSDTTSTSGVILGFMDNGHGITIQTLVRFLSKDGEDAIELRIAGFQKPDRLIEEIESELSPPKKIPKKITPALLAARLEPIRHAAAKLLQRKHPEPKSTPYPRSVAA
jgi:hypothetical protein